MIVFALSCFYLYPTAIKVSQVNLTLTGMINGTPVLSWRMLWA